MSSDLHDDVLGFAQSERLDDIANYAARGRQYQGLSDDDAKSQWVNAFRSLAIDFVRSQWWAIQSDLAAELELRGLEPPYNLVRDDMEKLSKGLNEAIKTDAGDVTTGDAVVNRFHAFRSKRTN